MGVTGLLPFLQKASRPAKMREFAGTTIAVDIYVWLHKGAFSCAEALAQGRPTDAYVKYVMRWCDMLLHHKIKPILVFDGRNLPSKALTEKKRRAKRKENREKAMHLLREGRRDEAFKYFQTSIDITPEMARNVIAAARERNIDCIVAPYEADAQLAYLNMCGLIDYIITEDSDLCLFGCQKVLFKLKETGDCILYDRSELGKVFGNAAVTFNFDKFRYMCIMSGCDYLESLPGIGLAKAMKFWQKASNPDLNTVLKKIPTYLNMNNLIVSQEYIKGFIQANRTLLHQIVYDPVQRSETYLTPLTQDLKDDLEHSTDILNYCGSFSHPDIALQLALGNLDLHTLAPITHFNPDDTLKTVVEKPKYGYRTTHSSIWRPEGQKTCVITTSSTEQPMKGLKMVDSEVRRTKRASPSSTSGSLAGKENKDPEDGSSPHNKKSRLSPEEEVETRLSNLEKDIRELVPFLLQASGPGSSEIKQKATGRLTVQLEEMKRRLRQS